MNRIAIALAVCVVGGGAILASTTSAVGQRHYQRNGRDSFLRFQVDSTDELVAVLKTNPTLRKRYARHFGVPETEVVDFIKRSLVPHRLSSPRTVTVYGVTRSGRIYGVRERLRAGTRVWATRSGEPVLKWLCANPMTKTLPGTGMASRPRPVAKKVPARQVATVPLREPEIETKESEMEEVAMLTPETEEMASAGSGTALVAPVPAAPVSQVAGSVEELLPRLGGRGGGFPLGAALAVPVAVAASGRGGGGSTPPTAVVVPEPGTLGLLAGAGLPALAYAGALRRRRRRSAVEGGGVRKG